MNKIHKNIDDTLFRMVDTKSIEAFKSTINKAKLGFILCTTIINAK